MYLPGLVYVCECVFMCLMFYHSFLFDVCVCVRALELFTLGVFEVQNTRSFCFFF